MELSIKFNPLSEQVDTVGFDPTEKGSIPLGGVQIREIGSSFSCVSPIPTSGMLNKEPSQGSVGFLCELPLLIL